MPHLPPSAQLWLERADIDYIVPFVKAWASFNAWFRHACSSAKDADGLRYVKQQPNPVRNGIMPLLQPVQRDEHGRPRPDDDATQKFKFLVRDLHVCLENFHIEVVRDEQVERISFRAVCLGRGPNLPQRIDYYGLKYSVDKINKKWKSVVASTTNSNNIRAIIEQDDYDTGTFQDHDQFRNLSYAQRAYMLELYRRCNPRPFSDLFAGTGEPIVAGDIEFKCGSQELFATHRGDLRYAECIASRRTPADRSSIRAAYEAAYRIVMQFLNCLRN